MGLCELIKSDSLPIREKVTPITLLDGVKHIVNCLEGKEKPLSTGEDGRAALELLSAFHLSARNNGEKIYLPLKDRNIKVKSK